MAAEDWATERIKELAVETEETIIADCRYFHAHPELSGKEVSMAGATCARLARMGIPYERVAKTGVIVTIAGTANDTYDVDGASRRRIALRADIDALPVVEYAGFSCTSKNSGAMLCMRP